MYKIQISSGLLPALAIALFMTVPFTHPVHAVGSESSSGSASTDVAAIYQQAKANISGGNYAKAIRLLKTIVAQDNRHADAYNLLGFASRKLEKYKDAQRHYARALQIAPDHLGALEYQGELFLKINQLDQAQANLARLLAVCGATCAEYLDLKQDIARFQSGS